MLNVVDLPRGRLKSDEVSFLGPLRLYLASTYGSRPAVSAKRERSNAIVAFRHAGLVASQKCIVTTLPG